MDNFSHGANGSHQKPTIQQRGSALGKVQQCSTQVKEQLLWIKHTQVKLLVPNLLRKFTSTQKTLLYHRTLS